MRDDLGVVDGGQDRAGQHGCDEHDRDGPEFAAPRRREDHDSQYGHQDRPQLHDVPVPRR
ncbi:hypothetical protein GCM10009756_16190 [Pseudokineococcus marinus]